MDVMQSVGYFAMTVGGLVNGIMLPSLYESGEEEDWLISAELAECI